MPCLYGPVLPDPFVICVSKCTSMLILISPKMLILHRSNTDACNASIPALIVIVSARIDMMLMQ